MKYMQFENDHLYHVYNLGNNSRKIFFTEKNYDFFLRSLQKYILPHVSILAWCLIPNQFDLLLKVDHLFNSSDRILNDSIGIMLRSYSRAINRQQRYTGSLFQQGTKALCLDDPTTSTYSFYYKNSVINPNSLPEIDLTTNCMKYIHSKPVKSGLVFQPSDWLYTSYKSYVESTKDGLITINIGTEIFKQTL